MILNGANRSDHAPPLQHAARSLYAHKALATDHGRAVRTLFSRRSFRARRSALHFSAQVQRDFSACEQGASSKSEIIHCRSLSSGLTDGGWIMHAPSSHAGHALWVWHCPSCRAFHVRAGQVILTFTAEEFAAFTRAVIECYCQNSAIFEDEEPLASAAAH
ncbi:MAG: hypothetical protein C4334_02780 [Pyrinomonas sp.]